MMIPAMLAVTDVLDRLEAHHGKQKPVWPTDPYQFLVWWHSGYPASDVACAKGWKSLRESIGIEPDAILAATDARLAKALAPGGIVPELRAERLQEVAARAGDLREPTRKVLKSFPSIGDPGADRILLFAGVAAVAAVPSNCPHVLVRILRGREGDNYNQQYKAAQQALDAALPADYSARERAYLLIKVHGQELCKRSNPACDACPLQHGCAMSKAR